MIALLVSKYFTFSQVDYYIFHSFYECLVLLDRKYINGKSFKSEFDRYANSNSAFQFSASVKVNKKSRRSNRLNSTIEIQNNVEFCEKKSQMLANTNEYFRYRYSVGALHYLSGKQKPRAENAKKKKKRLHGCSDLRIFFFI